MPMRIDPFQPWEQFSQQLLETNALPSAVPMNTRRDASSRWHSTCPVSVLAGSMVEHRRLTAQRPPVDDGVEYWTAERPRGVFSRRFQSGNNLALDRIDAGDRDGELRVVIPVAETIWPRKITVSPRQVAVIRPIAAGGQRNDCWARDTVGAGSVGASGWLRPNAGGVLPIGPAAGTPFTDPLRPGRPKRGEPLDLLLVEPGGGNGVRTHHAS